MATVTAGTELRDLDLRPATLRALSENGATVVGDLLHPDHRRAVVGTWPGVGASRLADLDAVMGRHGLAYGKPISDSFARSCQRCEICPDCGNPRADSRRNVAVDLHGRVSHIGHRVGPTCDKCDVLHRKLFVRTAG